jgi:polar amino acid transport system substrate-binding protein
MTTFPTAVAGAVLALSVAANAAPTDAAKELAPTGRLRAAINFGNPVLAQKQPTTGEPGGVSVALAQELGRRLGLPVDLIPFAEAGQVTAAAKDGKWDIAFLAIDPVRAAGIDFTAPYVLIEGTYAVPSGSPLQRIEDADADGVRVGVAAGSAYDLFLGRKLTQARIVRAANTAASVDLLLRGDVDALAGVRQPLAALVAAHPELRLIPGRFMEIDQAMGTPKGRETGLRFLNSFVEEMKASGFVAAALATSGQRDVPVAPPAPLP